MPSLLVFGDYYTNALVSLLFWSFDESAALVLRYYDDMSCRLYRLHKRNRGMRPGQTQVTVRSAATAILCIEHESLAPPENFSSLTYEERLNQRFSSSSAFFIFASRANLCIWPGVSVTGKRTLSSYTAMLRIVAIWARSADLRFNLPSETRRAPC
jgi:hypothetical protein